MATLFSNPLPIVSEDTSFLGTYRHAKEHKKLDRSTFYTQARHSGAKTPSWRCRFWKWCGDDEYINFMEIERVAVRDREEVS